MSTRVLTNTLVKRGLKSKLFPPTQPQSSLTSLHARYKRPVARRTKTEHMTKCLLYLVCFEAGYVHSGIILQGGCLLSAITAHSYPVGL